MLSREEILKAASCRSAIKKFDPNKKISDDDWQFLLEIARLAPSSYGFEPWNILVVGDEMREKLKPALGSNNAPRLDASHFAIFTVKNDLGSDSKYFRDVLKSHGLSLLVRTGYMASFKQFQNGSQDLTDDRKRHDWAAKQAYIAFGQMIFAAAEIGIDSCPIEGFDKDLAEKILSDNGELDLQTDSLAVMAAFGYRAAEPHPKTRRPLDEIVKYTE